MRMDVERLRDILEAIDKIHKYTDEGRKRFDADELIRSWVLRHIEIIGEAASRLSEDIRRSYPTIPWRNIIGMRNALIHGYFDVDWNIVWGVVEKELQPLQRAVSDIMAAEGWS